MSTVQRSIADVAPTSEPVSLDAAKKHLEIASAEGRHDVQINRDITAARQSWEELTQRATVSRTYVEKLFAWPDNDWRFYHRPIISLTSITYFDIANASQTLASTVYSLDAPNRQLFLAVDQTYPTTQERWDAITVTYIAGQAVVDAVAMQGMLIDIKMRFDDQMPPAEMEQHRKSYQHLVERYVRSDYP